MKRLLRHRLQLLLLAAVLGLAPVAATDAREPARIVAVGDVHGAYDALLDILGGAGLVDGEAHWAGGDATLVQVGDLLDRGAEDRKVVELMMQLEKESRRAKGRLVALLGNHEVMNLQGDRRYVSPASYASFADENSEQRLKEAYQSYLRLEPLDAAFSPQSWESFVAARPKGFLERCEALGPKGELGRWLRHRQALAQVGDVVFLHGGLHPDIATLSVRQINDRIEAEISTFDDAKEYLVRHRRIMPCAGIDEIVAAARAEVQSQSKHSQVDQRRLEMLANYWNWLVVHPSGPLWYRGLAEASDAYLAQSVPTLLDAFHVKHIAVGHTPQLHGGIVSRLGGEVLLIDTGMLEGKFYPGGVMQALEITASGMQVVNARGERTAVPSAPPRAETATTK